MPRHNLLSVFDCDDALVFSDTLAESSQELRFPVAGPARNDDVFVLFNGEIEETGLGAGVLNDPAESVAWLARRMAGYGQRIEPGQVILSGSFVRPVECPAGSEIHADFGGFGSVDIRFD